tara:strand:- start:7 stop:423 length:417 start_codon:yes stop_codon:yes gene_type:complete
MQLQIETKKTGPLFRPGVRNRLHRAKQSAMQELVGLGEERLAKMLRSRPSGVYLTPAQAAPGQASTGHYRRNIHGQVQGEEAVIHDSGVVYGPWLEGTSRRNMTTRFKGYATFRKTRDWLQGQMSRVMGGHVMRVLRR